MPVRLRITLVFALLVFVILALFCSGIYYFTYQQRLQNITNRLTNRATTTARLLSQREIFDRELVQRIDSSTTISLKNKTVQAYDYQNELVYQYFDITGDSLSLDEPILNEARVRGNYYFKYGDKEAIAVHYTDSLSRLVVVTAAEDVEGLSNLQSLSRILIISFLVGNLFVLLIGYTFSTSLLQPIRKISADIKEISAFNLTRRLSKGSSRDEWMELADTLNGLLNRLQESFEMQRRFISNASHELNTPLTAINSQIDVTLQRDRTDEEYRSVMRSIKEDVDQLRILIQNLLQLAKTSGDAGGLELNFVRVDEVVMNLPSQARKYDADYKVHLDLESLPENEDELVVYGNESLLNTAIQNIVLNACKYSGTREAFVTLSTVDGKVLIKVIDKGVGIERDQLAKIFQPFYRIDASRSTEGFGLGLSLADRIIKMHKGELIVESEQGRGSKFTVLLPVAVVGNR